MLGNGTRAPRAFSALGVTAGTRRLVAGAQGSPESRRALALRCLNSDMKKNVHRESQNRLALSKLNGNVFSSQLRSLFCCFRSPFPTDQGKGRLLYPVTEVPC